MNLWSRLLLLWRGPRLSEAERTHRRLLRMHRRVETVHRRLAVLEARARVIDRRGT